MSTINIGHRGHAGAIENTIPAFHEAIDLGAVMVEFDVQLSKDGVPVVFHDYTLKRMADRPGSIRKLTSKYLTKVELAPGVFIPTLKEVLQEITPRIPVNIEMKFNRPNYRPLAQAVGQVVTELGLESRVLVSSFLHQSIQIVNRYYPEIATAPLYLTRWSGDPHVDDLRLLSHRKGWKNDLPFHRPGLVLYHKMITPEMAELLHSLNLTIMTFTVDEPEEMQRLRDLGVKCIVTNRPERLNKLLS